MTRRLAPLRPSRSALVALAALAVLAAGCGSSGTPAPAGPVLLRVEIAPGAVQVARGASVGLAATAIWDSASPSDATSAAAWSSSNPAVAEVAGSRVVGKALGTAVVTAAFSGHTATALVTVTPAALVAVQVDPASAFLPAGTSHRFTATGVYTDGTTADLSTAATWSSSASGVAAVVAGAAPATVRGAAAGAATLSATVEGHTGEAALTVGAPVLESLRVEPAAAQVPVGLEAGFAATGVYSDGSTADLTADVLWSAEGGVAFFTSATAGTVHGLAAGGPVRVQAMLPGAGAVGEAALTVTAATVVSVDVTPAAATLPKGLTRALTATAVYSDGSHGDVTSQVTWSSADGAVAAVSNAPASAGTVSAAGVGGPVAVTATLAAAGGIAGHADVTVTAAAVTAVEVSPAVATVAAGRTVAFTAAALLSDGQRQPATEDVTWTSADPALASLSNVPGARGLASGLRAGGPLTVRARLPGLETPGEASLTVSGAELTALSVEPAAPSLAAGTSVQLRALGRYSDGTVADLTGLVAWTSAASSIADAQAGAAAAGRVLAVAAGGPVAVTARLAGSSLEAAAQVTVTPAVLVSLAVSPAAARAPLGRGVAFTATGTFSDGTTQDLTRQVSWLSGDDAVATVSNAYAAAGFAQSRAEGGPVEIRAWFPGTAVSAAAAFTVDPPALVTLAVAPAAVALPKGRAQQLQALGTFTDGVVRDLTATAAWSSAAPAAVVAVDAVGAPGRFRAALPGAAPVEVTAAIDGQSAACAFTVLPPVVDLLAVSPPSVALEFGASAAVTAAATYSDGAVVDVTAGAAWESSIPGVVRIQLVGAERRLTGAWLGATTVTATFGGASGSTEVTVSPVLPLGVRVVPAAVATVVDRLVQLGAVGIYSDGSLAEVTREVAWSISPPGVATVGPGGELQTLAVGGATVTARLGGRVVATVPVTVTATAPVRSLASLIVFGASAPISVGGAAQLSAYGWYDDGAFADLTREVTWSSDRAEVASVDAGGLVRGLSTGITSLQAHHGPSGLQARAALAVVGTDQVVALTVEGPPLLTAGAEVQLRAVGHLANGLTVDLTRAAAWVALSASPPAGAPGRFTAAAPALRVAALWKALQAEVTIPVVVEPSSVRAVPAALHLAQGGQGVLQFLARWPGSEPEESAIAPDQCSSSAPAVATCDSPFRNQFFEVFLPGMPVCDGGAVGTTTLTCTFGPRTVQVQVTVADAPPPEDVTDVFIRPQGWLFQWSSDLLNGAERPLLGAATWPPLAAGGTIDLELVAVTAGGQVAFAEADPWGSTDPRIATAAPDGAFTARAAGEFAALARLGAATAAQRFTVVGAPPATGLRIEGPAAPVEAGALVQLRAVTTGEGGLDVTSAVAWTSSNPAVASFTGGLPGLLEAKAPGTITATATSRDGLTASVPVTVTGVTSLRLLPAHLDVGPGTLLGFGAVAYLADGRPRLVNDRATWSVADPGLLDPFDQGTPGAYLASGLGATQVQASMAGHVAVADVVVSPNPGPAVLDGVVIYEVPDLLVGEYASAAAVSTLTDGTITPAGPGWTVTTSNPAVLALIDGGGQPLPGASVVLGQEPLMVGGVAEGVAVLTVTEPTGTLSDSAPVHVTTVKSLLVRPGVATIGVRTSMVLTAIAVDGLGRERPVQATWSSSDPQVAATLDPASPEVVGQSPGTATITATAFGFTATATVEVTPPVAESLALSAPRLDIELGQEARLDAVAHLSDGSSVDVTAAVLWRSLDPSVADFRSPAAPGVVTGLAVGEAPVIATLDAGGRTLAAGGLVGVHASLQSIQVQVGAPVVGAGSTLQAAALATWGDGSGPTDATSWVEWASSDPSVLAPVPGAPPGQFRALAAGTATLSATAPSGQVGTFVVDVIPPFPVVLDVFRLGGPTRAAIGETVDFQATAVLTDGSLVDVTAVAVWDAGGPAGLVVSPGRIRVEGYPFGPLEVTARLPTPNGDLFGQALLEVTPPISQIEVFVSPNPAYLGDVVTVSATAFRLDGEMLDVSATALIEFVPELAVPTGLPGQYQLTGGGSLGIRATFEGAIGVAFVDVLPVPLSIALEPAAITVEVGQFAPVTATALMSDGTAFPVVLEATWGCTGPEAAGEPGGVIGQFAGTTELQVVWTVGTTTVRATAPVTVTPAAVGLELAPASRTVGVGDPAEFTATLLLSDGTTRDVTAQVPWFAFDPAVVPGPAPGAFTVSRPGIFYVEATWEDRIFTSAMVEVLDVPVALYPGIGPQTLTVNGAVEIRADAAMASGAFLDASGLVTWTLEDPTVAVVEPDGFGRWQVRGLHAGGTTIHADWTVAGHAVSAAVSVFVVDPVVSLEILPRNLALAPGASLPVSVRATFASGLVATDLPVEWGTQDAIVAGVLPGPSAQTLVTAGAVGDTWVSATWNGAGGPVTTFMLVSVFVPPPPG